MIGLFGIFNNDRSAPADNADMVRRLPEHLSIQEKSGGGVSVGYASHDGTCVSIKAGEETGFSAYVCGWIANCGDFTVPGVSSPTAADVILHITETQDFEGLARINGQFCAVVYDEKNHRLHLITDRNGTFPLYVWRDSHGIAFASQLYALAGLKRVPKKAEPSVIAELFVMQRTLGDATPIAGVKALPSACCYTIDREQTTKSAYWALEWKRPEFSKSQCAERLAQALQSAVARQVALPGGAGLLLSGGLDSRMVLAAAPSGSLSCWTTASYETNPELTLAKQISALFGAQHHACVISPEDTFDVLESTVIACGGLYPASTPVSAFLPDISSTVTTLLTGHGLDYTLRGYYLPSRFLSVAGSKTRLPVLRPIPPRPTGHDVLNSLRQGPPRQTLDTIAAAQRKDLWWPAIGETLHTILSPWLESDEPYNAWDAFILSNVSKHYAFTSMMAVRERANLANPAFDNDVFDTYLRMPPAWRCEGRVVQQAMRRLSPTGARIPNANTFFPADLHPWLEIAGLLGRGTLRRLHLMKRPQLPSESHSQGSWQNIGTLMRDDPKHRSRFREIQSRLDALSFGVIDTGGLSNCIDEHLSGEKSHTKLLRQLLTHDSWVTSFGIAGHA